MRRLAPRQHQHEHHVSILTRLGSRMRRPGGWAHSRQPLLFQSSPGLEAGCDGGRVLEATGQDCFNPHPAWKPDATLQIRCKRHVQLVSILTRLGSRMRRVGEVAMLFDQLTFQSSPGLEAGCDRETSAPAGCGYPGFNPHPAWKPDATMDAGIYNLDQAVFQSSPGLEAGCDPLAPCWASWATCFNPHPAWKPDATRAGQGIWGQRLVSILTRLGSRMRRGRPDGHISLRAVSILTRLGSRMRHR